MSSEKKIVYSKGGRIKRRDYDFSEAHLFSKHYPEVINKVTKMPGMDEIIK